MVPSVLPAYQWTGCPCGCESRPGSYTDPDCMTQRPIRVPDGWDQIHAKLLASVA